MEFFFLHHKSYPVGLILSWNTGNKWYEQGDLMLCQCIKAEILICVVCVFVTSHCMANLAHKLFLFVAFFPQYDHFKDIKQLQMLFEYLLCFCPNNDMLFRDLSPPKTCWHFSRMRWKIQERALNYSERNQQVPWTCVWWSFSKTFWKKKKSTEKKEISFCCATPSCLVAPSILSTAVVCLLLEPIPAVEVLCHIWPAKPGRKEEHVSVWGATKGTWQYIGTGACWRDERLPPGL